MSRTRRASGAAVIAAALVLAAPAALAADIAGTAGDDTLNGTEGDDRIVGAGGNDTISGLGGHDRLYGQAGADVLDGGDGPDDVVGGGGPDIVKGGFGVDHVTVGPGDTAWAGPDRDFFRTLRGSYVMHGGPGDDWADIKVAGDHQVFGDDGDDLLQLGTLGAATSRGYGGAGNDQVGAFWDSVEAPLTPVALVSGGDGDDALWGFARTLDGGPGNDAIDTFERPDEPLVSTIKCGAGVDTVRMDRQGSGPLDNIGADCEEITVVIWTGVGSGDPQTIRGTQYADEVRTSNSDDTVSTLGGNDRVQTDLGSDTVFLGPGDDYFSDVSTHAAGDVDTVTCGDGTDTVFAYRTDVVADDCEFVDYR
jgi:RTX calcium-binding nonapeptide repeat (4 copies)